MKRNSIIALFLAIVMMLSFVGCASSDQAATENMKYAATAPQSTAGLKNEMYDTKVEATADTASGLYTPIDDRKLIKNANVEMETVKYDDGIKALQKTINDFGGYIESSTMGGNAEYYSRYYEISVRVPAEKFDAFLSAQESVATVNHTYIWTEDVTDRYIDNETRIKALETKKDRLLDLLGKATDIKDIIELESALSETIYELETTTGSQNKLINRINFCTVNISLRESAVPSDTRTTPVTIGERIAHQFADSWKAVCNFFGNAVVFIAGNSPVLVLVLIFAVIVFFLVRKETKKSEIKRMARLETYNKIKAQQAAHQAQQAEKEVKTESSDEQ